MYQKHFGLTERPFSIAPDPRFLYMSRQHREALAHLLYGVGEGGGFVQLTGEVGTGKTTICRCLLEQLPDHVDLALILNPRVDARELLASLCAELNIPASDAQASIKALTDVLNAYLLDSHARGRRTVLMIDEAQNLSAEALEEVRLLTNLETTREKLLQIILVGQPELRTLLAREDLRQLSQRITARYHLQPISRDETAAYINHRLQVCGAAEPIFSEAAIDLVQRHSCGVPRLINVLCDRAMLGAFVEGKRRVESAIVRKAAGEVLPEEGLQRPEHGWRWFAAATLLVVLGAGTWLLAQQQYPAIPAVMHTLVEQAPDTQVPTAAVTPTATVEPAAPAGPPAAVVVESPLAGETAGDGNGPDAAPPVPEEPGSPAASASAVAPTQTSSDPPIASGLQQALAQSGPEAVNAAWSGLYRLWGVQADVMSDEQACAQAPGVGLRCLQASGSWNALVQLDRPAILLLISGERRVPVVLLEMLGDAVRVLVDGRELVVPRDELVSAWLGHYRILWRTPPNGSTVLRPGARGSDVSWVRERIQQATGLSAITPDPAYYDAGLKELVQEFQREQGLQADGVAGPRTLINLNNLDGQQALPRLGVVRG